MPIYINGEKVKYLATPTMPIKEVYYGDKLVWQKYTPQPVVYPYAMWHAVEHHSPYRNRGGLKLKEPASEYSASAFTIGTVFTVLGPGGVTVFKDKAGGKTILKLSRNTTGDEVTGWIEAQSGMSTSVTVATPTAEQRPYIPVMAGTQDAGLFQYGFNLEIRADNKQGRSSNITGSLFNKQSPHETAGYIEHNSMAMLTETCYGSTIDWRYDNRDGAWFQVAYNHNISWEHYYGPDFGKPPKITNFLGHSNYIGYPDNRWFDTHDVTRPEGVEETQIFFLAGAQQKPGGGGGQGGQGGRAGVKNYSGEDVTKYHPELSGWGDKGKDGGVSYNPNWRAFVASHRTFTKNYPKQIRVGAGAQTGYALRHDNESHTGTRDRAKKTSTYLSDGGFGGAGGKYMKDGKELWWTGDYGVQFSNGFPRNYSWMSGYNYSTDEEGWFYPMGLNTWDAYNTLEKYNATSEAEHRAQVPWLALDTYIPGQEVDFLKDTSWYKNKRRLRLKLPVEITWEGHTWPPEPTVKGTRNKYLQACVPGDSHGGEGGAGGGPGPVKGDGKPGKDGKPGWADAGGPGLVVMHHTFPKPHAIPPK